MKRNSKDIGIFSEASFLSKFISLGYTVSQPFGDNARYDFIIDRGDGLKRVQVKTARICRGSLEFHCCSHAGRYSRGCGSYRDDVEFFAVYVRCPQKYLLIPVHEVPESRASLRISEPKGGNVSKVRYASEFEI